MSNPSSWTMRPVAVFLVVCALFGLVPQFVEARELQQVAPTLGTAASFAVLGGSTVTNTGSSTVNGDLGVSPGTAVTGFPPGTIVGGSIHAADALAGQAQSDLTTAYNNLAGQACTQDLTGQDLGGKTLTPGVYCFTSSAALTGNLTLDAQGIAASVFVFKIGSTLTTATGSSVLVTNSANPCNAYWQVGSSATFGTTTAFRGNILALTSIAVTTGASVIGRTLARNGAVTLDTNSVSAAACGVPPAPTNTPTTVPSATPTPTTTPTRTMTLTTTPTLPSATQTAVATATGTAIIAATATLPAPTQTAIIAATSTAVAAATGTAITTLPAPTQTAIIAITATANAALVAPGPACVANIRGSKVNGAGNVGLPSWTIELLQGGTVIKNTVTDQNGNFDFLGLGLGTYSIREVQQSGWVVQGPAQIDVQLTDCGQNAAGFTFVNVRNAALLTPVTSVQITPIAVATFTTPVAVSIITTPVAVAIITTPVAIVTTTTQVAASTTATRVAAASGTAITDRGTPTVPSTLPRTGDFSDIAYIVLLLAGLLMIGMVVVRRVRG